MAGRVTERSPLLKFDEPRSSGGCCGFGKRHVLAMVSCCGFIIVYALRVNLSVALVAMVNNTEFSHPINFGNTSDEQCPKLEPQNSTFKWAEQGEFSWGPKIQGIILGSFFYGYILTQLIGGYLADEFGGKWLCGVGIFMTAALTLLTPLAARTSPYLLIALRVLEGIFEGVTYPAMYSMWGKWAPKLERSTLTAISFSGSAIGTIISFPISGIMCEYGFDGGWPSVFYVFGSVGCVWFLFWSFLVYNSPEEHPTISKEEKDYILSSIGHVGLVKNMRIPWKAIFTSVPVMSLNLTLLCGTWGFYTLLTSIPTYMKEILKLDITQNGLISALPYTLNFICSIFSGFLADFLQRKSICSTTKTRKIMSAIGLCCPAVCLFAITQVGCNRVVVIALLTLSVGLGGFCAGGYTINQMDLAPNYSGIMMGISNTFATIPGIVGPFVTGLLTNEKQSLGEWNLVFLIAACIAFLGAGIFLFLGSGKEQDWSIVKPRLLTSYDIDDSLPGLSVDHSVNSRPSTFDDPYESLDNERPEKLIHVI